MPLRWDRRWHRHHEPAPTGIPRPAGTRRRRGSIGRAGRLRFHPDHHQRQIIRRSVPPHRIPPDLGLRRHVPQRIEQCPQQRFADFVVDAVAAQHQGIARFQLHQDPMDGELALLGVGDQNMRQHPVNAGVFLIG